MELRYSKVSSIVLFLLFAHPIFSQIIVEGTVKITENCTDGKINGIDGRCYYQVKFHAVPNLSLKRAQEEAYMKNVRLATAEDLNGAVRQLGYENLRIGITADGRMAVPLRARTSTLSAYSSNVGKVEWEMPPSNQWSYAPYDQWTYARQYPTKGINEGFYYLVGPPRNEAHKPAPGTYKELRGLNGSATILLSPEEARERDAKDIAYVKSHLASRGYSRCHDYDQFNVIIDGWYSDERALMETAAKKLLQKEGKSAQQRDIDLLQLELKVDPVRRFQYAPFMLTELYMALATTSPNPAQAAYQRRFNKAVACKDWLFANFLLDDWKNHTNAPDALLQPVPQNGYKPVTLQVWKDVLRDRASKKGFIGYEINDIYSTPKGDEQLAMLLAPVMANNDYGFDDRLNLKSLGGDMEDMLQGTIGTGAAILGISATGALVYQKAYAKAKFNFLKNKDLKAKEIGELQKQLGKSSKEIGEEVVEEGAEQAAKQAAKQAKKEIAKLAKKNFFKAITTSTKLKPAASGVSRFFQVAGSKLGTIAAIAGTLITNAQILADEVADIINTLNYDGYFREAAEWKIDNVSNSLNTTREVMYADLNESYFDPNYVHTNLPEEEFLVQWKEVMDSRKSIVFKNLMYFNVSLPAERGLLHFEYPEIPTEFGKRKGVNGVQVFDVGFFGAKDQTLAHAKKMAASRDWRLATEDEVIKALFYLQLAGPRGMIDDGSFVFPVVYAPFAYRGKTYNQGLNKNIAGTNDGFYYVKIKPTGGYKTPVPPMKNTAGTDSNTTVPISNSFVRIQNGSIRSNFIHNQRGKLEQSVIEPNWWSAQWKIIPANNGWVRIQNRWKPNLHLNYSSSELEIVEIMPNWASALWKLEPAQNGWVRIQNNWYKDVYIHNQNGRIEAGEIDLDWESALWKFE